MVSYKRLRWRLDGPGEDARRCPNCEPGGYPAALGVVRRRSGPGASVTISPIHRRDDNDAPAIGAPDPRGTKARALHNILSAFTKRKYRRVLELWFVAGHSIKEASHTSWLPA